MKFFVAAAIAALAAISTVEAASESTVHIRVHVPDENEKNTGAQAAPVAEWGQCRYYGENGDRPCVSGTICRPQDQYYAQCIRNPAIQYGQCGGKNWTGECANPDKWTCKRTSDYYAQCVPK